MRLRHCGSELSIIRASAEHQRENTLAKSQWSFKTATELSAALAAKKVSAVELAQDAIGRIERHDGKINAICVRDFAARPGSRPRRRRRAARAARTKPLLGIPMTVKESYNVAGLPTTWGFPAQKDFMPAEDALSISRVKDAGGVILGKTNVPIGLGDWQSYNEIYGTTNNPFDLGRTPGGSSGGSSAALAAGYGAAVARLRYRRLAARAGVPLRRLCAQADLRLVPPRGHTPPPFPPLPFDRDLSVIGPMARCAADLSLLLDVIAGPDPLDAGKAYRLALPPPRHTALKDFRVLVIDTDPVMPTDTAMRGAIDKLAGNLGKAGVKRRAQQPAAAGLRRFVAALYADADVVPRRVLPAGGLCRRAGRRGRSLPADDMSLGRRAAARHRAQPSRLGDGRRRRARGCARNGANCSRRSTR